MPIDESGGVMLEASLYIHKIRTNFKNKKSNKMTTRAKMTLVSIDGTNVKFECKYDSANSPEDNSFSKYTPLGSAQYSITNESVLKELEVGKKYYFDIKPVDE